MKKLAILAVGALTFLGGSRTEAGGHWSVGIGIGVPVYRPYPCYGPYYGGYYYRPYYPVYVAPAPVVVQPAPVVQQVPVVQQPTYVTPPPATSSAAPAPIPITTTSALTVEARPGDVDYHLRQLTNPDERARADSVMQLGKMRAYRAVDPLAATLAGDVSPTVRESAARALGLIGSASALPALQRAAQADSDRDVRRSAQFASDVIQSRN